MSIERKRSSLRSGRALTFSMLVLIACDLIWSQLVAMSKLRNRAFTCTYGRRYTVA